VAVEQDAAVADVADTALTSSWNVARRPSSSIAALAARRMSRMSVSGVEGMRTNSVRVVRT